MDDFLINEISNQFKFALAMFLRRRRQRQGLRSLLPY
jgi:hypothetical protein